MNFLITNKVKDHALKIELHTQLIKELKHTQLPMPKYLASVINKLHKGSRRGITEFWSLHSSDSKTSLNAYLVIIHICHDPTLIMLAKNKNFPNFPRGFPIVWEPCQRICLYGFYPKFENDITYQVDNSDKLSTANYLDIMPKLSGFLGQCVIHPLGVIICSKNSTNNSFSDTAESIIKNSDWFNNQLYQSLLNDKLYFCGEVMSFNDQTHGAKVLKELFVVTCIGQYLEINLTNMTTSGRDPLTLSKHLNHDKLHQYCVQHNMPVTSIWSLKDDLIPLFVKDLTDQRDFMTLDSFYNLVKLHNIVELKGTVDHRDFLGQTLEGLIIWVDGEPVKYKFPEYTHRTFCYRSWLAKNLHPDSFKSIEFQHHLDKYIKHWVIKKSNQELWRCRILGQINAWFNSGRIYNEFTSLSPVGLHIRLSESYQDSPIKLTEWNDMAKDNEQVDVIVFIGPIGCGKSSNASHLANSNLDKYYLIDGDSLSGLSTQETLLLRAERNHLTKFQLIKALVNGKIPIISTGGGALANKDSTDIFDFIYRILGFKCNLHLYLPCNKQDINKFYSNWCTDYIIQKRLKTGEWSTNLEERQFMAKINDQSKNNVKYALDLARQAVQIYQFQPFLDRNYQTGVDKIELSGTVPQIYHFKCTQLRILVKVTLSTKHIVMGHITIRYEKRPFSINVNKYHELMKLVNENETGTCVMYQHSKWSFVHLPSLGNDITELRSIRTHVTVDSGPHLPVHMGSACKQIQENKDTVSLPSRKGNIIDYPLSQIKQQQVKCDLVDVFMI